MMKMTCAGAILMIVGLGCNGNSGGPAPGPAGSTLGASSAPGASSSASAATSAASAASPSAPARAGAPREGSVIARSPENDALYVADEDHRSVQAIALPVVGKAKLSVFQTPGAPAQAVVVGERLLVTVRQVDRGEGALLLLKRKGVELEEAGRIEVPVDAWGVSLTPDDAIALVTSAWTHKLSAVDLATKKVLWSIDTAREPRGVVVLPGSAPGSYRAYVSHLVGSDVTRVDFSGAGEPALKRVELPAAPLLSPWNTKLTASQGYSLAASPKGDLLYFPRAALGALGPNAWFGEFTVDVMMTENDVGRAPPRNVRPVSHITRFVAEEMERPNGRWLAGANPTISDAASIAGPRATVYRRKTNTILIASEGTNTLVELDALAMAPSLVAGPHYGTSKGSDPVFSVPLHGSAPAGVALSEDENDAYVYCRATNDVILIHLSPDDGSYKTAPSQAISLNTEEDKLRGGRALFYTASNSTLSGGMACAGCHPEGRDDGFTWHETNIKLTEGGNKFTNFLASTDLSALKARWGPIETEGTEGVGYARQTPMLAGRVAAAGPYGWHAESKTLEERIRASFQLHRWDTGWEKGPITIAYATQLAEFIRLGLTPPPKVERPLTDQEKRGKELFESPATQCATCHVPQTAYTDRNPVPLKAWKAPSGFAEDPITAYKTPSLLHVGGSPPYMHDGRFGSLETLFEFNQDRMGKTSQLSADDRKALIAFLRTL